MKLPPPPIGIPPWYLEGRALEIYLRQHAKLDKAKKAGTIDDTAIHTIDEKLRNRGLTGKALENYVEAFINIYNTHE